MTAPTNDQPSRLVLLPKSDLDQDLREFLVDRRARNLSPKTLRWYEASLGILEGYLRDQSVGATEDVTAGILRRFLIHLKDHGHNPGGVRNIWGAVKAFLRWYEAEAAPAGPGVDAGQLTLFDGHRHDASNIGGAG